jgi:hypothetical protein
MLPPCPRKSKGQKLPSRQIGLLREAFPIVDKIVKVGDVAGLSWGGSSGAQTHHIFFTASWWVCAPLDPPYLLRSRRGGARMNAAKTTRPKAT